MECKRRNSKLLNVDQAHELGIKVPKGPRSVYTQAQGDKHGTLEL